MNKLNSKLYNYNSIIANNQDYFGGGIYLWKYVMTKSI